MEYIIYNVRSDGRFVRVWLLLPGKSDYEPWPEKYKNHDQAADAVEKKYPQALHMSYAFLEKEREDRLAPKEGQA